MPVEADRVPVRPFLEFRDTKYYGLTVNPNNGRYMWPTLLITSNKVSCIAIRRKAS